MSKITFYRSQKGKNLIKIVNYGKNGFKMSIIMSKIGNYGNTGLKV